MANLARLRALRSYQTEPGRTIMRAGLLALRRALGLGYDLRLRFGSARFDFRYGGGAQKDGGLGLYLQRERIEDLMEFGDRFLRAGDTVIDGGANQGYFTAAFSAYVGAIGRVVAIEPMPHLAAGLTARATGPGCAPITAIEAALADADGTATLDVSSGITAASLVHDKGGTDTLEVTVRSIDSIVDELALSRVDFIKLDIEGAEYLALKGAARTIQRFRPILCLEVGAESGPDTPHGLLIGLGYRPHAFAGDVLTPIGDLDAAHANVFYLP